MKKLLLVLAIGAFAACNNGETTETTDSTTLNVDSVNAGSTTVDTLGTGTGTTTDTLGTGTGSGQ